MVLLILFATDCGTWISPTTLCHGVFRVHFVIQTYVSGAVPVEGYSIHWATAPQQELNFTSGLRSDFRIYWTEKPNSAIKNLSPKRFLSLLLHLKSHILNSSPLRRIASASVQALSSTARYSFLRKQRSCTSSWDLFKETFLRIGREISQATCWNRTHDLSDKRCVLCSTSELQPLPNSSVGVYGEVLA